MTSSPVDEPPFTPPGRGIYANRTLNVRSLRAVGFDMDYTLIHYRVDEWERAAFTHALEWLAGQGWPVDDLQFDPDAYTLGLTFDLDLGNLVKATRFGHVVKAQHGTRALGFDEQRTAYAETVIDLAEERFEFMNTLFELSRAALWCQLIDVHDAGRLPGVVSYADLWRQIDRALSSAHQGGRLKAEIVNEPDRFVVPDPELVETLRDMREAGKQLLLITNSDWEYTRQMMAYAVDPFVDEGSWRDLFDIVIVSANKPSFFEGTPPIYRVVDEAESLLRPHFGPLEPGHVYFGGNARLVEQRPRSKDEAEKNEAGKGEAGKGEAGKGGAGKGEAESRFNLPDRQDIDRMLTYLEDVMGRMMEKMKELTEDKKDGRKI